MKEKTPTETVRIPSSLARRIGRIASHREQSVPKYLAEALAKIVDRDEQKMLDDISRERGEKPE